jgi:hypothetical protein
MLPVSVILMPVAQQNHLNDLDSFTLEKGWAFPSWSFLGRAPSTYEGTFGGGSGSLRLAATVSSTLSATSSSAVWN